MVTLFNQLYSPALFVGSPFRNTHFYHGLLGQAVDRLNECTPALLITRTYVESLPGHEAAMYLRTKCPEMKVLMVGGLLDDERLEYRAALQGFEVFPKPYTAAALLKEVKDVLSKPRGEAEKPGRPCE